MKTVSAKPATVAREWLVIDAAGIPLGRLASRIAYILLGKHKPLYTKHVNMGDAVVVINAEKVAATGSKELTKVYYHHTGYPGGIKENTLGDIRRKHPTRLIEKAVKCMIPRTPLGRQIMGNLKIYVGSEHPHVAQQPRAVGRAELGLKEGAE